MFEKVFENSECKRSEGQLVEDMSLSVSAIVSRVQRSRQRDDILAGRSQMAFQAEQRGKVRVRACSSPFSYYVRRTLS